MMSEKIKTKKVEQSHYLNYFKKAESFHKAANSCINELNYEAAALACIHCVISAIDAFLVFKLGVRSTSERHGDVLKLLAEAGGSDSKQAIKHADAVLSEKTVVEYLDVLVTDKQVLALYKHTDRFFCWVKERIPKENRL
ncbi:MAG: HEPN domain-containing protein [Candidatus Firestonebacteria bacterium]